MPAAEAVKEVVSGPAAQERWEEAMAGASGRPLPYRMEGTYAAGDVIDHARFGKGVVVKVMDKKCAVLFRDQERLMAAGL
jgi:hypothetical protein